MTGAQFGSFLLGLVVVAIVVAIAVWLLHWLYLRSSKERSFVRTGLGGQKVVLDGGAFVLPIVHDVIVLCHGGPIATPEDAAFILSRCPSCHGFYGASSMERLPTEAALTETTQRFTRIPFTNKLQGDRP